jgi:hypothetical protein
MSLLARRKIRLLIQVQRSSQHFHGDVRTGGQLGVIRQQQPAAVYNGGGVTVRGALRLEVSMAADIFKWALVGCVVGLALGGVYLALQPPTLTRPSRPGDGGTSDWPGGNEGGRHEALGLDEQTLAQILAQQLVYDASANQQDTLTQLRNLPAKDRILAEAINLIAYSRSFRRTPASTESPSSDSTLPPEMTPEKLGFLAKVADLIDAPQKKAAALLSIAELQRQKKAIKDAEVTLSKAKATLVKALADGTSQESKAPERPSVAAEGSKQSTLMLLGILGFCAGGIAKPILEMIGKSMSDSFKDRLAALAQQFKHDLKELNERDAAGAGSTPSP